jgi:hypothetical protein
MILMMMNVLFLSVSCLFDPYLIMYLSRRNTRKIEIKKKVSYIIEFPYEKRVYIVFLISDLLVVLHLVALFSNLNIQEITKIQIKK